MFVWKCSSEYDIVQRKVHHTDNFLHWQKSSRETPLEVITSALCVRSCVGRDATVYGLQFDITWLTDCPVSPLSVGQYVNNSRHRTLQLNSFIITASSRSWCFSVIASLNQKFVPVQFVRILWLSLRNYSGWRGGGGFPIRPCMLHMSVGPMRHPSRMRTGPPMRLPLCCHKSCLNLNGKCSVP